MKNFALILAFISTTVFAQGATLVRGDSLKRREYQTYSSLALFVDAASGNNTNACTASGASACATVTGALAKLPRFINFPVTITLASGTIVDNVVLNQFIYNGTGTITITGATPTAFSVVTGSATGTITTVAGAASGGTTGIITDSGQTWTVNDLRGRFIHFTSGPNSSRQVIVSNTATTLTVAGGYGGVLPVAGNTYTIETNASIISPASGGALTTFMNGNNTAGGGVILQFTNIDFTAASTVVALNSTSLVMRPSFTECRIVSTGATIGISFGNGPLTLTRSYVATTGFAVTSSNLGGPSRVDLSGSFLRGTGSTLAGAVNFQSPSAFNLLIGSWTIESLGGDALFVTGGGFTSSSTITVGSFQQRIVCTGGGGGTIGVAAFTVHNPATSTGSSVVAPLGSFSALKIEGCGTGLNFRGGVRMWTDSLDISGATNSVVLNRGAVLETDSITISSSTNDVTVDGVVYALATVQSFSPKRVTNQLTGSEFNTET